MSNEDLLRECAVRIRTLVANAESLSFTVVVPGHPRRHISRVQLIDLARLEGMATMIDEALHPPEVSQ